MTSPSINRHHPPRRTPCSDHAGSPAAPRGAPHAGWTAAADQGLPRGTASIGDDAAAVTGARRRPGHARRRCVALAEGEHDPPIGVRVRLGRHLAPGTVAPADPRRIHPPPQPRRSSASLVLDDLPARRVRPSDRCGARSERRRRGRVCPTTHPHRLPAPTRGIHTLPTYDRDPRTWPGPPRDPAPCTWRPPRAGAELHRPVPILRTHSSVSRAPTPAWPFDVNSARWARSRAGRAQSEPPSLSPGSDRARVRDRRPVRGWPRDHPSRRMHRRRAPANPRIGRGGSAVLVHRSMGVQWPGGLRARGRIHCGPPLLLRRSVRVGRSARTPCDATPSEPAADSPPTAQRPAPSASPAAVRRPIRGEGRCPPTTRQGRARIASSGPSSPARKRAQRRSRSPTAPRHPRRSGVG